MALTIRRCCLCWLLWLGAGFSMAWGAKPTAKSALKQGLVAFAKARSSDVALTWRQARALRAALWSRYRREFAADQARRKEHLRRRIRLGKYTMHYSMSRLGSAGARGYPLYIALHGGGGGPSRMNDGQWRHMQIYYKRSVKRGIYIAPRGITNTWNLHFVGASYPLYERLIENMLLFEKVDPDRVYLLGFSAGGDGVYQIAPRLADRFAAANMSAGHHNNTSPINLMQLPFLLQVGQWDRAYKRHLATVAFARKLALLARKFPGYYKHQLFVHAGRGHNFRDNHPGGALQSVLATPMSRAVGSRRGIIRRDTNAIHWLKQHTRVPLPTSLRWDLKTRPDLKWMATAARQLWHTAHKRTAFYWLDASGQSKALLGDEIAVVLHRKKNVIEVKKAHRYVRILLTPAMLDLTRPLQIKIQGQRLRWQAKASLRTMVTSLLQRGDPHLIFEAAVCLRRRAGRWTASDC